MNFVYSTEADALYIELEGAVSASRTVEVTPTCLVDLDPAGQPIGIELIHPSHSFLALARVVDTWPLSEERMCQLLAYPYQSLTPSRRSASGAAHGRVQVNTAEPELLTCA